MHQVLFDYHTLRPGSVPGVTMANAYTRRGEYPSLRGEWDFLVTVSPPNDLFTAQQIRDQGYSLRTLTVAEKRVLEGSSR